MKTESQSPQFVDEKTVSRRDLFFWPFVVLFVYFLSFGPIVMMIDKGTIAPHKFLANFYSPLVYAYEYTPLHKPLGMYMHFWSPHKFDKNGN